MSTNECAPYATARTSILVFKGKGILVKRALSKTDAIQDAINEFDIQAEPTQICKLLSDNHRFEVNPLSKLTLRTATDLTSFVGAQGQEVEISNSAFAYMRDTVPIHVHLKEEDDGAERPRWPALPLAGLIQEPTKPEMAAVQPTSVSRFPYIFGFAGGEGSKTTESKVASKLESISDWQRRTAGTPDTSASVHQPHLGPSPDEQVRTLVEPSPGEMLSETAMNSLVDGYVLNASSSSTTLPESQAGSSATQNAGKAWNWFKRAGTGIKGPIAAASSSHLKQSEASSTGNNRHPSHMARLGNPPQTLHLRSLPKRPNKDDMQSHRHTMSSQRNKDAENITEEIETLLQDQPLSPSEEMGFTARSRDDPASGSSSPPGSWGPGALVLDDGISESSASIDCAQDSKHRPWWAKPVDAFDEKNRRKLGLKPLHLKRNDQLVTEESNISKQVEKLEPARQTSRMGRPPSIATCRTANGALESGKISPGAPLAGQRRRRNSKLAIQDIGHHNARPLPADIPESPFSSRRFTKMETMRTRHKAGPFKGLFPQDAVAEATEEPLSQPLSGHGNRRMSTTSSVRAAPVGNYKAERPNAHAISSRSSMTKYTGPGLSSQQTSKGPIGDNEVKPIVPVAKRPPIRPMPSTRSANQQSGAFAAAALAARRSNTSGGTAVKQRTSLSSLKEFVPAELSKKDQGDNDHGDEEVTVVTVQRLVLDAVDLASPNGKGSRLVIKSELALSRLTLQWHPDSKAVLRLPFDSIEMLQLPDPECSESFIIIKTTTGNVRDILVEVDAENLLLFQRFLLVFIMGMGANMDLLSLQDYRKACNAHGW